MFLFINSLVASLDGLIIGINLKLTKIKLTFFNLLTFLIFNTLIYFLVLKTYYLFNLSFISKNIATIIYLFLALNNLKSKEQQEYNQKLNFFNTLILALSHSLDGSLISLNFIYQYSLITIISLFSFMAVFILLIGYYFANLFKHLKNGNFYSALLFIILAIFNYFS